MVGVPRNLSDVIRDQDPLILRPETSVRDACQHMHRRRVGAVLVASEDGRLLGIFTGRDAVCRIGAEGRDTRTTSLAEVMTPMPVTMSPGGSAIDALRLMQDGGFRHVPVVENGRIAGIVSRGDFRAVEHRRLDEETGLWERV